MTIEEELKTTNFNNLKHKTVLNILFTGAWLRTQAQGLFKKFGLSSEQFNVLRILRGQYPNALTLKDITARMLERNSNTTRIVDKLVGKGFVERTHSQEDKRELKIQITPQGLELLAAIDVEFIDQQTYAIPHLSSEECGILNTLLDKLRQENKV